jgi:hypothetical protein
VTKTSQIWLETLIHISKELNKLSRTSTKLSKPRHITIKLPIDQESWNYWAKWLLKEVSRILIVNFVLGIMEDRDSGITCSKCWVKRLVWISFIAEIGDLLGRGEKWTKPCMHIWIIKEKGKKNLNFNFVFRCFIVSIYEHI